MNAVAVDADYELGTSRLGMWIFLSMEMLFFGGALFLYSGQRHFYPEAFGAGSAHLELGLAAFNTAVLMTSSLTMASAVHFLEQHRKRASVICLALTAVLGAVFLALKGYEYFLDYGHGTLVVYGYHPDFTAPKEVALFFSLYLFLTGLHAVHLTLGVGACSVIAFRTARSREQLNKWRAPVDLLGLYWHFVDVVWVFLLPLLYLIRSQG